MNRLRRYGMVSVVLFTSLLACLVPAAVAQERGVPQSIVRQVVHIVIRSDPFGPLYRLFAEDFQLPVASPPNRSARPAGYISAGNVYLEFISVAPLPSASPSDTRAAFMGFSFEPLPLEQSVAELDRRGITHGPVEPFSRDPKDWPFFTLVMLTELSERWDGTAPVSMAPAETGFFSLPLRASGLVIYLSEYHDQQWPEIFVRDLAPANRPALREQLRAREGGPLGILGVKEITIGVTGYSGAIARWERGLRPAPSLGEGAWAVGEGPAIRLVPATDVGILSLTFAVQSIARTRDFLAGRDMRGESSAERVTISPSTVQGLDCHFVEAR